MKKLWARLRPRLRVIGVSVLVLALVAIGVNGYRVAASKPDGGQLEAEYDEGYDDGYFDGEAHGLEEGEDNLRRLRGKSYWNGWEEGLDEGWDEGYEAGEELLLPAGVDSSQWYVVHYDIGDEGPTLGTYSDVPLGSYFVCEDFDACTQIVE